MRPIQRLAGLLQEMENSPSVKICKPTFKSLDREVKEGIQHWMIAKDGKPQIPLFQNSVPWQFKYVIHIISFFKPLIKLSSND